ncbi:GNAT family N-acetyltransferase [Kaistia dalseonensis]|uniref:N-acetyltransferase domain-containing protein n=1 Tax=Kaistia dalseonensis TaxID=410840 RepID=A0ABU0H6A3_9HYPH|nr:GNAT family N-acetyltransferase [Kaistia dalseonensis]MCX5495255.1 GNAT family N-acetyltransferase [Kaistia dalseonensis]MDQ0437841.1 hypothetical protein [Kaistia dalseonensis]
MTAPFSIRTMTPADLDRAISWAGMEGWNPGLGDAGPFLAADPGGFLMGYLDDEPITAISVVRYGDRFGFLGFYICRPAWRGKGYGWQTWQAGMDHLGTRTVGLDGVVDQQENYRRSGFAFAYRNVRFGGHVTVERPDDPRLVTIEPALTERIQAYDAAFFPAARRAFLDLWLAPSGGRRGLALVADGTIRGYGVIRPAVDGFKIGPLFAETEQDADLLFRALAAEACGAALVIDPPEPNEGALRLVERYGLTPSFETARMYRGVAPSLPIERIFGVTSFELG